MRKCFNFCLLLLFSTTITVFAQEDPSAYKPHIDGTIRAKYEYNTNTDAHRFQVRNARFSVNGKFSSILNYKAEVDLSDEGVIKMLDANLRFQPVGWWNFTIGQQKVPFSTDNLRSPYQLYFANRSFIGKQLTGLRDVGGTFEFKNFTSFPLSFQAGLYNGAGIYNQKPWHKIDELSVVLRSVATPINGLTLSANYNSINPATLRMFLYNVGLMFDLAQLHLESEFLYKTYKNDVFSPTQGFFSFASYRVNILNNKYLTAISPGLRYDMMSENKENDGLGVLNTDLARSRITGGFTFSLNKPFLNDIRFNYEHYFYAPNIANADNKFVAEFVVRF